jgi:nitrogen regulatory protein P-II 1
MKLIIAIIRPEKLPQVMKALQDHGIYPLTVFEVRGRGEQGGLYLTHGPMQYHIELLPKVRIEIAVSDKEAEKVVDIIQRAAWTGRPGDGKIFILPLENVVRIRTGERGERAL